MVKSRVRIDDKAITNIKSLLLSLSLSSTGIFTLATYEAYCVLCSHDPLLTLLPTSRHTMYEKIILLRHASVAAFVAISQIGPILFPPSTATKFKLQDSLLSLNDATGLILKEAKFGLKMSVDPFVGDGKMVGRLQRRMEKLAVDLKLQETLGNEYKKVADRTRSSARKKMN